MTRFKTIVRYSSYLLGSRLLSRVLFTVFFIYAASLLGPELFGALSFTLVTVELLSSIGDLGITRYAARELVRHWDNKELLAGEVLFLQGLTSVIISLGGLLVILAWQPQYPKLQMLLLAMAAVLLSAVVNTTEAIFVATHNFLYSALFTFIGRLVYVSIGLIALYQGASVVVVMLGFLIGVIVEATLRLTVVLRRVTTFSFGFSRAQMMRILSAIKPFALTAAANIIFLRANVVILEILSGDAAVGIYNIAFTLFVPFVWLPMILQRTVFPGLTRIYAMDPGKARIHTWQWYRLMALVGIPIAISVGLLAGPVLSLFPAGYEESIPTLMVLMASIPLMLISSVGFNTLQVVDREGSAALASTIAAVTCILSSFILIALFNVIGAALAFLMASTVLTGFLLCLVYNHFLKKSPLRLFIKPLIAGAAMLGAALFIWNLSTWLAPVVGIVVYTVVVFVIRAVRLTEIKTLIQDQ
ncbi:polysaccharide biosynthesis protein [bacterium BMS3Abin01]|nr:polysaccharide biosynthesis protein [bacterium BMS3Abin01]